MLKSLEIIYSPSLNEASIRPVSQFFIEFLTFIRFLLVGLILTACSHKDLPLTSPASSEIRIGFGSCILTPASPIWHSILLKHPDVFLFLGDNIYLKSHEIGNIDQIRRRYNLLFAQEDLKALRKQTKIYAIWDDHDFNLNNRDSRARHIETSLKAFREVWSNPSPPPGLENSIAHKIQIGPIKILMTDNRTYRINSGTLDATTFGKSQLDWIKEELRDASTRVTIIGSGGQILGTSAKSQSLDDYPADKELLLQSMSESPSDIFILSGDRHYAEVLERTYNGKRIIEATSSPLSAPPREAKSARAEEYRRALYLGISNFAILTLRIGDGILKYDIAYFDSNGNSILGFSNFSEPAK